MFGKPSLFTRIGVGKTIGFIIGLMGFFSLPYFWPEASLQFRLGILFWYTSLGAIIGIFGVLIYHPILKSPIPWWLRGVLIGGWMNLLLTLFIYDKLTHMMLAIFGTEGILSSPYWLVLEGMIIGLLIEYFARRFGGEGKATLAW